MSTGKTPRISHGLSLSTRLNAASAAERKALLDRIGLVVSTLSGSTPPVGRAELLARLDQLLASAEPSSVWLALSVIEAELATFTDVRRAVRAIRLDGVGAALGASVRRTIRDRLVGPHLHPKVRVFTGGVLVDLDHTARAGLATGIQRVARETVKCWTQHHQITLVGWGKDHRYLRLLGAEERTKALTGKGTVRLSSAPDVVVVPWKSTYLLPELSPERDRNERIGTLAQFAQGRTGVIGFDCVPFSTAETTALGVGEAFATNLAAVRHMDTVAAISRAAAVEYGGWRNMLASLGEKGPTISAHLLPAEVPPSTEADLDIARAQLTIPGLPMVLCVGTHEPRKNHLALLHAAELLWRDGLRFNLVLVGGRSWNDDRFRDALAAARARNRPIDTPAAMPDRTLWAAYRLARCMVFPSLNEGFGLPVAEALACGTPVITSGYGSMAEIAEGGGALLVDPRDDRSIAAALRTLLTDDAEHARLAADASTRPRRTWDDYARDVWGALAS